MSNFKLGCNFDFNLIDSVVALNDRYPKNKISEFYGSERKMAWLTARPDFRLPDISKKHLEKYIKLSNDAGIVFNYTMNTINPGSKRELEHREREIGDFLKYLRNIGINRITVANPILLEIIRSFDETIEIETSTIMHLDTVSQAKYLHEKYNLKKICCALHKNRSVQFLKQLANYCNENDVTLELMVNEFCGVGGVDYATACPFRHSCYICHASDKTKEDALLFNNYPMGNCMSGRNSDPYNWLRLRWIRPEDLKYYNSIGIDQFKITGRTGTTEYITSVAEAYMSEKWNDNLLGLWKPLETITSGQSESEFDQPYFIDNSKLDGFLDHWFDNPQFECGNELCGTTCTYCKDFYLTKMKGD